MKSPRKPRIKKLLIKGRQPRKIETREQAERISKQISSRFSDPKKRIKPLESCLKRTTDPKARQFLEDVIASIREFQFKFQIRKTTEPRISELERIMADSNKQNSLPALVKNYPFKSINPTKEKRAYDERMWQMRKKSIDLWVRGKKIEGRRTLFQALKQAIMEGRKNGWKPVQTDFVFSIASDLIIGAQKNQEVKTLSSVLRIRGRTFIEIWRAKRDEPLEETGRQWVELAVYSLAKAEAEAERLREQRFAEILIKSIKRDKEALIGEAKKYGFSEEAINEKWGTAKKDRTIV